MAWAAARLGTCGSQVTASRYSLGAEARRHGRCAPGRLQCSPPDNLRALPLIGGDVEDVVRFALLETLGARRASRFALLPRARVGRGGPDIIMCERAGERSCAAAACAVRVGAERHSDRSAFSPGQADPPRFQRACCSASRSSFADTWNCAPAPFSCDSIMVSRAGSPLGEGVSRIL